MWGAVIGDLAGSIYEYDQYNNTHKLNINKLINKDSFYSDDTILTMSILYAMLNDKDFERSLKEFTHHYMNYKPNYNPYFNYAFSPNFIKWSKGNYVSNSQGNGALMRISPVGYLSNSMEEVLIYSYYATYPSHNNPISIYYATLISQIIYLSRHNYTKEQIINKYNINYKYKEFTKFNTTVDETINNCLYAAFKSNTFEEALTNIISYGGDTDTNAAIVGSMAESIYGIPPYLIEEAKEKLSPTFNRLLEQGYKKVKIK